MSSSADAGTASGAEGAAAETAPRRVVLLAGGVGGAKLAFGLQALVGTRLTVIVNTGDDLERHGLLVEPDHDTVMYTLAGIADREQGWGVRDETFRVAEQLEAYGEETWFRLGDRDLATHIVRTAQLRAGRRLTEVDLALQRSLGIAARILPMTDVRVRTEVLVDDGWLEFQEYFVHRRQQPTVHQVRFRGIETARPGPEVVEALASAEAVIIGPSNPIVSVGPIVAVPGLREALAAARERGIPIVAVSGIVAGKALRGPADRMLASLGHESSALGVARIYAPLIDGFVLDPVDAGHQADVAALGIPAVATDTIMTDNASRQRVAGEVLDFAGRLGRASKQ